MDHREKLAEDWKANLIEVEPDDDLAETDNETGEEQTANTYLTGTEDLTDKISMLENMENTWHSQIKIITFTFFLLLFHTDKLEDDEAPDCRPVHSTQYTAGYTLSDQV